jgi:hypothetical protein
VGFTLCYAVLCAAGHPGRKEAAAVVVAIRGVGVEGAEGVGSGVVRVEAEDSKAVVVVVVAGVVVVGEVGAEEAGAESPECFDGCCCAPCSTEADASGG